MKKSNDEKVFVYPISIEPCEEGGFFAECSALQGVHAEGETYAETLENIEQVIKAHLEVRGENQENVSHVELPKGGHVTVNLPIMVKC